MTRSFLLVVILCACTVRRAEQPEPLKTVSQEAPATGFDKELATLDGQIRTHQRRADRHPFDWLVLATMADLYMVRGRLTGSYADYDQAQLLVDAAFEVAPDSSGPFLSRAGLHYTMHRLIEAEADLASFEQRIRITDSQASRVTLMRANIAAQRGQLDTGIAGAKRALKLEESPGARTALAMMLRSKGQWDAAEVALDHAAADYHGSAKEPLAWIMLHRGIFDLERGRHEDALAHYQDAARVLDGWWLVDEHIAEIMTLQGDLESAQAMYQDIVSRTGKPEFMDAMARIASAHGATEDASAWHDKAHRIFEHQVRSHPEAAAGHALGHFLQDGAAEAERSLSMAQANAALRPNTEALALLAQAEAALSPRR